MRLPAFLLCAVGGCFPVAPLGAAEAPAARPPSFEPAAQQLAQLVESFVARDEIVGAELLVWHEGRPILHRAFGFKDREARRPIERDTLFAVRSMTKPFTGMAAQILADEGKLDLDAPVAKYLPSFDRDGSRAITIRHVLTHRSGLPLGFLGVTGKLPGDYSGLRELADLSAARGPEFSPGSRFQYSDDGSDVLGAVVATVSGQPLEDFVARRILAPLGLADTFPEGRMNDARRQRIATRYSGMARSWRAYWAPDAAPPYLFLKGSGGLMATPRDYARFLQFWIDRRTPDGETVLSPAAFARALTPVSRDTMTTGFSGARCDYGQMWMLFCPTASDGEAFAFGHSGSDGTLGYAFPRHNLIVCYFTQSRGNTTLRAFEEAVSHLFLQPDAGAFARLAEAHSAGEFADYLGLYARDNRPDSVAAMIAFSGRLAFELPNRQLMLLRPAGERDRWVPERAPNDTIVFRCEGGNVAGFTLTTRGNVTEAARFSPRVDLPSGDDVMALRGRAAAADRVARILPLRIVSTVESQGRKLPVTLLVDKSGRQRRELDLGDAGKLRVWVDGERVWRLAPGAEAPTELQGLERTQELDGSFAVAMGDWREVCAAVLVLGREKFENREVFRVRLEPREGLASTKLVSAETGAVAAEYGIAFAPGAGLQPTETRHADFRDVEGVMFSFSQALAIGGTRMTVTVSQVEPRARLDDSVFAPIEGRGMP